MPELSNLVPFHTGQVKKKYFSTDGSKMHYNRIILSFIETGKLTGLDNIFGLQQFSCIFESTVLVLGQV